MVVPPVLDFLPYVGMKPFAVALVILDGGADGGAAGREERGVGEECDGWWKLGGIDGVAFTGVDKDGVVGEDVIGLEPAVEGKPVVGPDEEDEVTPRIASA